MSAGPAASARPAIQFAPEDDVPIRYMERTRAYYQALGFSPYRWAHFTDAPELLRRCREDGADAVVLVPS